MSKKLENVKKKVYDYEKLKSDYEKLKSDYNKNTLKRMFQTKPEEPQKPSYYDNYKENEVKNNEIIDFLMELIEKIGNIFWYLISKDAVEKNNKAIEKKQHTTNTNKYQTKP